MTYEVGQEVVFRSRTGRRGHSSPDRVGKVTRVARKYCTVEFAGMRRLETLEFDKETGGERGNPQYPQYLGTIKTADEWAAIDRRANLLKALREIGVDLYRVSVTSEQLEAVAVVFGIEIGEK